MLFHLQASWGSQHSVFIPLGQSLYPRILGGRYWLIFFLPISKEPRALEAAGEVSSSGRLVNTNWMKNGTTFVLPWAGEDHLSELQLSSDSGLLVQMLMLRLWFLGYLVLPIWVQPLV